MAKKVTDLTRGYARTVPGGPRKPERLGSPALAAQKRLISETAKDEIAREERRPKGRSMAKSLDKNSLSSAEVLAETKRNPALRKQLTKRTSDPAGWEVKLAKARGKAYAKQRKRVSGKR